MLLFFFLVVLFGFVFCPAEYFLQLFINKSSTCNRNKLIKYEDGMCLPKERDQGDSTEECAKKSSLRQGFFPEAVGQSL